MEKMEEKSRKVIRKEARAQKRKNRFSSWIEHKTSRKMSFETNSSNTVEKPPLIVSSKTSIGDETLIKQRPSKKANMNHDSSQKLSNENHDGKAVKNTGNNSKRSLKVKDKKLKKTKKKNTGKSKTKFEQYLEMDMNKGVSAEEDLEMERKLAKKLKVNEGKLRGVDDGMNALILGFPNVDDLTDGEDDINGDEDIDLPKHAKGKRNALSMNAPKTSMDFSEKESLGAEDEEVSSEDQEKVSRDDLDDTLMEELSGEEDDRNTNEGSIDISELEGYENNSCELKPCATESPNARLVIEEPSAKDGNVKYVAPHLRSRVDGESEDFSQIRRQVRGLLNKLSESNVESITGDVSNLFQSVGRSAGSQIVGDELLSSCSKGPRGNEQYAAIFAAFIAGMASMVGINFGAKILASVARSMEDEYLKDDGLSLRNLTLLLSQLCIFGVCSCDLIYDLLSVLSKRLTEMDVSTILTILKCCGMKLRADDPAAMKDFVLGIQQRVREIKSLSEKTTDGQPKINSKRMEFMLETICDIKNNKKRTKEDPVNHARLKKWLQKLRVEEIQLRGLKWAKLLDPYKKGQWWVSGDIVTIKDNVAEIASTIDTEAFEVHKLLQLAAAQRMNTDARRAIFCIIISGEDYIDAFEKILRLDLNGKQDREIMRVLVECCLQEKVFNKYYAVLASKLCNHDKNHKFTLQYCLWDHFKQLDSIELRRSMNLAHFVAELLSTFTLSLAVLKSVDFTDPNSLTPRRVMHFRLFFEALFEHPDSLVWNMFSRIAGTPELEALRNGIELFIKQCVLKVPSSEAQSLKLKFKVAKKALNNVAGILM
ncbi:nucleolar MIF4G domain-containing protein 1 isoform X1 [Amborella trichopoda]|nr:nucleolar MIF4G domain-containing protein 1 isoform X1 [Amborella trichopoda]|eukprot:XP_020517345.1 nucleolar MIF4G domain-containing protein 1 isoform X1 [Amborella trichopoda]